MSAGRFIIGVRFWGRAGVCPSRWAIMAITKWIMTKKYRMTCDKSLKTVMRVAKKPNP